METSTLAQQLYFMSEAIERQQAVAVIGAGVSAARSNGVPRRLNRTLPTGSELVKEFCKSRSYLKETLSLPEAAFVIKQREGRLGLVKLVHEIIGIRLPPLPAHHALAKLPFVAYVSFNFDELLEDALERAGRAPHIVIRDKDIAMTGPGSVTVIKPHGTISQLDTIRIASDEILELSTASPLVSDLLRVTIAQRRLLYLGFSLSDPDFVRLHRNVVASLGEYAPTATAVVLSASEYERTYWREQGVSLVETDLNQFLEQLAALKDYRGSDEDEPILSMQMLESDPWIQDPFFTKLLVIRSLPSETQVIEALLAQVEEEAKKADPAEVVGRLKVAVAQVLQYRPNYAAFGRVGEELVDMFEAASTRSHLETSLRTYRTARQRLSENLSFRMAGYINEGDGLYIYSQSRRVIQSLVAVIPSIQETCTIYIGECRPKSPTAFQDAYAIYESLQDTYYKIRLIPDAAFAHLVERKKISKVLMGAHQLCEINGRIEYFVNTCGSLAITRICEWYKVPIFVIAETDKIEAFSSSGGLEEISRLPEENLSKGVFNDLSRIRPVATGVRIENYGYDVCPVTSTVTIVTNKD